jgi:dTDP-glucose 4,6-dehydratase
MQERDWLFVEDHCEALEKILFAGIPGESYHLGSQQLRTNLEVSRQICKQIDFEQSIISPRTRPSEEHITFVKDRPGHDHRYGLDCKKMEQALGWQSTTSFEQGITTTVKWYLNNPQWMESVCHSYEGRRIGLL